MKDGHLLSQHTVSGRRKRGSEMTRQGEWEKRKSGKEERAETIWIDRCVEVKRTERKNDHEAVQSNVSGEMSACFSRLHPLGFVISENSYCLHAWLYPSPAVQCHFSTRGTKPYACAVIIHMHTGGRTYLQQHISCSYLARCPFFSPHRL